MIVTRIFTDDRGESHFAEVEIPLTLTPVPRIGTLVLTVSAVWTSPFASGRQVLTFHTRACSGFAPPICRMSLGQSSGQLPN
jgi:hypothetical protein